MKNLIDQLALGKIEYDMPDMEISVSEITLCLKNGTIYEGSFQILSQSAKGVKGLVYVDNASIEIEENAFYGKENVINYRIHATAIPPQKEENGEKSQEWKGAFYIVSDAGEGMIPYEITIEHESVETSLGTVRDLYHFANLVQMNYEEAARLFFHHDFKQVFLKGMLLEQAIYDSVIQNANRELAIEEFLLAVHKKKKVELEMSDARKEYLFLNESYGDCVVLTKSTWGYIHIDVEVEGKFLVVGKHTLTSDDFAGSNYEFHYLIDYDKCADGMNFGRITFRTLSQKLELDIVVDNRKKRDEEAIRARRDVAKLMDMYLKFRLRQYPVDKWMKESLDIIDHIRGTVDNNDWVKLVQAQIYLTQGKEEEAGFILDFMENRQKDVLDEDKDLYAYYLYVRTLQKNDPAYTKQTVATVKHMYENGHDSWQLLWVLLYLDDSLEYNKSLKLLRLKEQCKKGCNSPLMYYEALDVLNHQPELLRMMNSFELQVLYFGHKSEAIHERLAKQIVELAVHEKKFRPLLFKILCGLYEKLENIDILSAICGMIIRSNMVGDMYFKWLELGVEKGLKIAGLYEAYMNCINTNNMLPLPKVILMYFSYNENLMDEKRAYMYCNILKNRRRRMDDYEKYLPMIEQYAMEQMMAGNINTFLARIYREVMKESMITPMIAKRLPDILRTYYFKCDNQKIEKVYVAHKEFEGEEVYPVVHGKAYIPIYTEDAVITLGDRYGNRIMRGIEYECRPMFQFDQYLKKCYQSYPDNPYLLMYFVEKFLKYHSDVLDNGQLFERMLSIPGVKKEYKLSLTEDIIGYYVEQCHDKQLDAYLKELDLTGLSRKVRVNMIELMISRGLYNHVYAALKEFGLEGESPRTICRFCSRYISMFVEDEDEYMLLWSMYAFRKGKYDETVLDYLSKYYYGNSEEMIEIWKSGKEFGFECAELEERIIVQLIFTRAHSGILNQIFASYYDKRIGQKLVCAYLTQRSYDYFVKEAVTSTGFFAILEKELNEQDYLPDICKIAYLRYMSEQEKPEYSVCKNIENMLQYLEKKGYLFSFYKKFIGWCKVPYRVVDQTVLEYRCSPSKRVFIHYMQEGVLNEETAEMVQDSFNEKFMIEEMRDTYPGVFTKNFTLFYGEDVLYYITEEGGKQDMVTQSDNLNINFREKYDNDSRFGLLNDMMVCMEMQDNASLKELKKTYIEQDMLTEKLFRVR